MAETDDAEKTEDASERKLDEALKKGDVAKSQEVTTWFMLAAAALVLYAFAGEMSRSLTRPLRGLLEHAHDFHFTGQNLHTFSMTVLTALGVSVVVPIAIFVLAGIAGNLVQHRAIFTTEPLKPKLEKISPIAGFKRLFSMTSLVNFLKGVAKLVIVSVVMTLVLWPDRGLMVDLVTSDPTDVLAVARMMALKIFGGSLAVLAIVAALDYAYQRHKWLQKQRMTIKEVRDEYKQMEGDPTVRAKLRQIRLERGRKRMMASVPDASVVVMNPTHFAVALKYEPGMRAPLCVAKGMDRVALRIRDVAEENRVPVVENPPLARALHASVEIDDEVPPEHYKAVAEVIGYVMRLGRTVAGGVR